LSGENYSCRSTEEAQDGDDCFGVHVDGY
jgi:hypothetical protein